MIKKNFGNVYLCGKQFRTVFPVRSIEVHVMARGEPPVPWMDISSNHSVVLGVYEFVGAQAIITSAFYTPAPRNLRPRQAGRSEPMRRSMPSGSLIDRFTISSARD